jgi:hypothetical protein
LFSPKLYASRLLRVPQNGSIERFHRKAANGFEQFAGRVMLRLSGCPVHQKTLRAKTRPGSRPAAWDGA